MKSKTIHAPDLTQRPPRSPRVRLGGYATLPRCLDKGRATLAGKNGEYHFACPLDQRVLEFAGIKAEVLKKQFGDRRLGIEGYAESRWILLDFGDIVIHLFDQDTRSYYDLEHLWAGAKRVPFECGQHIVAPLTGGERA